MAFRSASTGNRPVSIEVIIAEQGHFAHHFSTAQSYLRHGKFTPIPRPQATNVITARLATGCRPEILRRRGRHSRCSRQPRATPASPARSSGVRRHRTEIARLKTDANAERSFAGHTDLRTPADQAGPCPGATIASMAGAI